MFKPCLLFAVVLTGCAGTPVATAPKTADAGAIPPVSSVPVQEIEIANLPNEAMRCESLTRPGSRIVVAQRCIPINEEALADQLNQVSREQDELDRLAREREGQRRGAGL